LVLLRTLLVHPLVVMAAMVQAAEDPYRASVAAMEASIARQKQSVARQLSVASPPREDFFHASWPLGSAASVRLASSANLGGGAPSIEPGEAGSVETAGCSPIPPAELQAYIEEIAAREGFSPDLLRAVIHRESAFYPCAVSRKGAQGLMQIMPETGADLGLEAPFDPWQNIDAGARFLGQLLTQFGGDISLALGAYNAGPSRVRQYEGLPPIPETLNYVADIMDDLRMPALEIPAEPFAQVSPWETAPLNIGEE
jgi:soluble lytic murein transglycosylase-like protein